MNEHTTYVETNCIGCILIHLFLDFITHFFGFNVFLTPCKINRSFIHLCQKENFSLPQNFSTLCLMIIIFTIIYLSKRFNLNLALIALVVQLLPTKFKLVIVKTFFFFWVSDLIVKTKIIKKHTCENQKHQNLHDLTCLHPLTTIRSQFNYIWNREVITGAQELSLKTQTAKAQNVQL